jgi:hypothetical protein
MPRYVVTTRRDVRAGGAAATALAAVTSEPGVTVVQSSDPHMVTIDASPEAAERLKQKLAATHIVEPEVRRSLH